MMKIVKMYIPCVNGRLLCRAYDIAPWYLPFAVCVPKEGIRKRAVNKRLAIFPMIARLVSISFFIRHGGITTYLERNICGCSSNSSNLRAGRAKQGGGDSEKKSSVLQQGDD